MRGTKKRRKIEREGEREGERLTRGRSRRRSEVEPMVRWEEGCVVVLRAMEVMVRQSQGSSSSSSSGGDSGHGDGRVYEAVKP